MLSFVVPAYNEEKYLAPTLASIHEAARAVGEPYEIVVADDASTDATVQVAQTGGARVVHVEKRQIAGTRNAGAKAAHGEWLVFVDADTQVNADVVRAAREALRAGAVGGGAAVRFADGPRWLHVAIRFVIPLFRWAGFAAGCFVFARRDAFEAVGGFDEAYYASEEIHLSRALARRGRFVVLRESVQTSARKTETHTFWEMVKLMVRMGLHGPAGLKTRAHTKFWYPEKR